MCFGGPKPPQIVYQGPDAGQVAQNAAAMETYKQQMAQQQKLFSDQLQKQIEQANQDTADLKGKFDQEAAAAAAAAADASNLQSGAYSVAATQSDPVNAQTTAATTKKEKPKANLKISTAALPSTGGTGLNIGV